VEFAGGLSPGVFFSELHRLLSNGRIIVKTFGKMLEERSQAIPVFA
jgi:hypothetical protein